MTVKLDDDLVGHQLAEQDLKRRGDEQFTSFEWQALDLLREIYSAGVRSFIRAVGISDRLLGELVGARSRFEAESLGGETWRLGPPPSFEGFFLVGIALGSQVCTNEADLAALIESPQSAGSRGASLGGPFKVWFVDGEVSSGLHEGAVNTDCIPLVEANWDFEGFAYEDALEELFKGQHPDRPEDVVLVATPPGFTPTGLLNFARAVVEGAGAGFGNLEGAKGDPQVAGRVIVGREWLSAGIWLGLWLRARQMELGVVGELREDIESDALGPPSRGQEKGVYQLVCGWEYGQDWTAVLADVRRAREGVTLATSSGGRPEGDRLARYFLGRLQVQMSIYSCQATGDFTWWPVYSFLRKGDIVLIRLAPFPRISREEMKAWFPGEPFEHLVLKGGASLLPDQEPALLGLERDWTERSLPVEAERLWENVPYLKWLVPETPEEGVVNDGLDGLGIITSDAVWDDGCWQATVGMVRPFVRPVRFDEIAEMLREVHLPLFPHDEENVSRFDPGSLTMLANVQFLPSRTELNEQELSTILRVASGGNGGAGIRPWDANPESAPDKGGLSEPPHALVTDFERLKLVRENLRRGWRIEQMGDISPWPVEGTWLQESARGLFPGRLRLPERPDLSAYPCWTLWRSKSTNELTWRGERSPWYLLGRERDERFKGDHPAVGARSLLERLAEPLVDANPPVGLLLAVPADGQAAPLEVALAMASRIGGSGVESKGVTLEAQSLSGDVETPQVLGRGKWNVDPAGTWTRPGSTWRIGLASTGWSGSSDAGIDLFIVGTRTVTSVIDIESVSAQVTRLVEADATI